MSLYIKYGLQTKVAFHSQLCHLLCNNLSHSAFGLDDLYHSSSSHVPLYYCDILIAAFCFNLDIVLQSPCSFKHNLSITHSCLQSSHQLYPVRSQLYQKLKSLNSSKWPGVFVGLFIYKRSSLFCYHQEKQVYKIDLWYRDHCALCPTFFCFQMLILLSPNCQSHQFLV